MARPTRTTPRHVTGPARARSASREGYVLVPVVMGLLLIALAALLLNNVSAMNVSEVGGLNDATRAEHVAQSGMERAIWRAQHDACGGDFVISATPLGPDRYEVTTTGGSPSTVYSLSADQDAWIRSDDPTRNNGISAWNHIRFETLGTEHALTRFDLSSVPAGAEIQSATAWFYVKNLKPHPEGPVTVHAITADWGELTVTWDSFAGAFSNDRLATIPAQDTGAVWVGINLTAQVQAWMNGTPNFGILFRSTSDGIHTEYTGRAEGTNPPRLEVVAGSGATSPLAISATGALKNGVTRTLSRTSTPAYQPPNTMTLRLGTDQGADAVLDSFYPRNYGGAVFAQVNEDPGWRQRPLFRFGMSGIPAGARVVSARLELRLRDLKAPGSASVHRLTRGWVEGTKSGTGTPDGATWATHDGVNNWTSAGGDFDATPVAETTIDSSDIWVTWEIASLVRQWLTGMPNHGVLIKSDGVLEEAEFYTREEADPSLRPRLAITYACECGRPCMAPWGSGNVLMVVGTSPMSLSPGDESIRDHLESWGYSVSLIQDDDSQGNYDAAIAASDVILVSESVRSGNVGTKLTASTKGVVNAEAQLNDELGIAANAGFPVDDQIDIVENTHYITAPFRLETVPFKTASTELASIGGTLAPGAQVLARVGGAGSVVALDTGATAVGGGASAGRRVLMPVGDASFGWDTLTNEGQLIVQRALSWGMGEGFAVSNPNVLFVVGNPASLTAQENAKKTLIESWGYDVNPIDDAASPTEFVDAFAANDVVYVSGEVSDASVGPNLIKTNLGVVNEQIQLHDEILFSTHADTNDFTNISVVDNAHYITDGFSTGWLPIATVNQPLNALKGTLAAGLQNLAEVWISGANYDYGLAVVDIGGDLNGGEIAAGRRVQIPWGATGFDFSTLNDNGKTIMRRALEWAAAAGLGATGPLAHWKLDDGTGWTAIDSEGGHDGTLTNGPSWVAGQIGDALSFDGSDDYVHVPHDDNLSLTTFSISAWIYPSALSGWQVFVNKGTSTSAVNYYLAINGDEIGLGFYNAGWVEFNTTTANLSTDQWYHVAGTYDDSTRTGTIYLDGAAILTDTVGKSPLPNSDALTIGRSGFGEYWSGRLDDVRIYDAVLTTEGVADLAAGGGGGNPIDGGGPDTGDACSGTYRDNFDARVWTGSNGSLDWSGTPWIETGESDGPTTGDIEIEVDYSSYQLQIQDNDNGGEGVIRAVDLSGAGSATISFQYRRHQLDNPDDYVSLAISTNGTGGPWIVLDTFAGDADDGAYQGYSRDITSYAGANTAIRLLSSPDLGRSDRVLFDDLEVSCTP